MGSYVFSELAVKDLNQICEFIAQTNVKAASKLFDSIRQKCKLVANEQAYLWNTQRKPEDKVDNFVLADETKIKWSSRLKECLVANNSVQFDSNITISLP